MGRAVVINMAGFKQAYIAETQLLIEGQLLRIMSENTDVTFTYEMRHLRPGKTQVDVAVTPENEAFVPKIRERLGHLLALTRVNTVADLDQ